MGSKMGGNFMMSVCGVVLEGVLELNSARVLVIAEGVALVAEPRRETALVLVGFAAPGDDGLTLEANGQDRVERRVPDVAPLDVSCHRAWVVRPMAVDLVVDEVLRSVEVEVVVDVLEKGFEIGVVHDLFVGGNISLSVEQSGMSRARARAQRMSASSERIRPPHCIPDS